MTEWLLPLATIALANLLGAMSPGPAFVLIVRIAVSRGRRAALAATLGLAIGAMAWTAAAIWGLQAVFVRFAWLHAGLRYAGGAFLIYLGLMIWRHAKAPPPLIAAAAAGPASGLRGVFVHALVLQLTNPKIMIFFGSIFVAVLPPEMPLWVELTILALILANEFAWYGLVAATFASATARATYARVKIWSDRAMGVFLAGLGARLMLVDR